MCSVGVGAVCVWYLCSVRGVYEMCVSDVCAVCALHRPTLSMRRVLYVVSVRCVHSVVCVCA